MFMPAILLLLDFVERSGAAAQGRSDKRALLAAEDRAEAGAGRGRSADDHGGFLPVAAAGAFHITDRRAADRRSRGQPSRRRWRVIRLIGGGHRADAIHGVRQRLPDRATIRIVVTIIDITDALEI